MYGERRFSDTALVVIERNGPHPALPLIPDREQSGVRVDVNPGANADAGIDLCHRTPLVGIEASMSQAGSLNLETIGPTRLHPKR